MYVTGITEHKIEAIGSIQLQIKLGDNVIAHKFYVMPNYINIPVQGILGREFLKFDYKCKIDYEEETITIKINNSYTKIPILEAPINSTPPINTMPQVLFISSRNAEVLNELQISNQSISENTHLVNLCKEFSEIFHLKNEPLSVNNFFKYSLNISDSEPVFVKNYRFPHSQKEEIARQVQSLLHSGQISKSNSSYNSPVLIVPKKSTDGKPAWRLVVDYKCLNKKLTSDTYPLPRIDEILDELGNNKYYSIVDLSQGFHQIPLAEESKHLTTFSTSQGSFKFNVLPFGLKVAPSAFARMMNEAFSSLPPNTCFIYLDDLIILGKTEEQHLDNIRKVFEVCKNLNLKLNTRKCLFFKDEVTYLGHKCSREGVSPDEAKYNAIKFYPRPQTKEDVKRFVAFANYYRRFIKNFANLSAPLNFLTRKSTEFIWSQKCNDAFEMIKSILISPTILKYPDFKKPFIITCDASKIACGAVLSQMHDGADMPIAYASKSFTKGESNKATIEQELLAIFYAIKHFRPYIYGTKFTIRSDHKPLLYLFSLKDPSSRLTRIRLELEEYNFEVVYIKGKDNVSADALSRVSIEELKDLNAYVYKILPVTTRSMTRAKNNLLTEQNQLNTQNTQETHGTEMNLMVYEPMSVNKLRLPRMKSIGYENAATASLNVYKNYKATKPLFAIKLNNSDMSSIHLGDVFSRIDVLASANQLTEITMSLSDPIFTSISPNEFKAFGNNNLRNVKILLTKNVINITDNETKIRIMNEYHNNPIFGGHPGQKRLLAKIATDYQWKNMRKDIAQFTNNCHACRVNKPKNATIEPLRLTPSPHRPFEKLVIDTLGPLVPSHNNNVYALTAICDLTKFIITIPIHSKDAQTVARAIMNNIILIYGPVKSILTDKGTEFMNATLTELCKLLNIEKFHSTPYRHETVGSIERSHRSLNEYLRANLESSSDWEEMLKYFTYCYNSTPHTSFNFMYSPFELVFCKKPPNFSLMLQNNIDPIYNIDEYAKEAKYRLQLALSHARSLLEKAKIRNKSFYDRKTNPLNVQLGEKVLINDFTRNKLTDPMYKGPYIVLEDTGYNLKLRHEITGKVIEIHKNNIKKY